MKQTCNKKLNNLITNTKYMNVPPFKEIYAVDGSNKTTLILVSYIRYIEDLPTTKPFSETRTYILTRAAARQNFQSMA
jgi:hypothetical protein